jgi:hypothetical protein
MQRIRPFLAVVSDSWANPGQFWLRQRRADPGWAGARSSRLGRIGFPRLDQHSGAAATRLGHCGASPIWAGAGAVPGWAGAPQLRLGLCPGERFLPPRGLGCVGPSRPFLLSGWATPFPGPRWSRPPRPLPTFAWAASGQVYPAFAVPNRPLPGT